jgi:hypothetical protein
MSIGCWKRTDRREVEREAACRWLQFSIPWVVGFAGMAPAIKLARVRRSESPQTELSSSRRILLLHERGASYDRHGSLM